jgi:hypothetical protein
MKALFLAVSFGLIVFPIVTEADTRENSLPRCQQLAHDFAENPDSLEEDRLKQLQFCIKQTLAQREATNPPTMLKGTIIEPLIPSENVPVPTSPALPAQD